MSRIQLDHAIQSASAFSIDNSSDCQIEMMMAAHVGAVARLTKCVTVPMRNRQLKGRVKTTRRQEDQGCTLGPSSQVH